MKNTNQFVLYGATLLGMVRNIWRHRKTALFI